MALVLTTRRICSNVLINARSCFWLQKDLRCQLLSTDSNNSGESSDEETQQSSHQDTKSSSDDIKHNILQSALEFVPHHGWTIRALSEGAKVQGLPGIAHGMFPRAGGDLMHHFVRECNRQLAEGLAAQTQDQEEDGEDGPRPRRTSAFIRNALETRLRMIIPYADTWPQAMALTAIPSNTLEHFSNLSQLMDDIWYYAGDRSADFNWYTKRITLAAVYKSTELHLVQDDSEDFQETWLFLDRRLSDVATLGKFRSDMTKSCNTLGKIASAAFTTGRNMAGLNDRRR